MSINKTVKRGIAKAYAAIDASIATAWRDWGINLSTKLNAAFDENLDQDSDKDTREELLAEIGEEKGWSELKADQLKSRKTEANRILKGFKGAGTTLGNTITRWDNESKKRDKNGKPNGLTKGRLVSKQVVLRLASELPKAANQKAAIEAVVASFEKTSSGSSGGGIPKTNVQEIQDMIDTIAAMPKRAKAVKLMQAKLKTICNSKELKEYFEYPED